MRLEAADETLHQTFQHRAHLGAAWRCPVCGDERGTPAFSTATGASEAGVDGETFRPSSEQFGHLVGRAIRCQGCGHASVDGAPEKSVIEHAYAEAHDPVSIREEAGQVETARRALVRLEAALGGCGSLLDVGCWTGSFLVAASERGWDAEGVEPSTWAAARATERGARVHLGEFGDARFADGAFDVIVCCDVLEHLVDPVHAVDRIFALLRDGGLLYVTVPDAGSRLARVMGGRWWAVLPMHLQYFTRRSMRELLVRHGFDVRSEATHPKVFSAQYYAERLGAFVPGIGKIIERRVSRSRLAERLVAPDFRDRLEMIAVKR